MLFNNEIHFVCNMRDLHAKRIFALNNKKTSKNTSQKSKFCGKKIYNLDLIVQILYIPAVNIIFFIRKHFSNQGEASRKILYFSRNGGHKAHTYKYIDIQTLCCYSIYFFPT